MDSIDQLYVEWNAARDGDSNDAEIEAAYDLIESLMSERGECHCRP